MQGMNSGRKDLNWNLIPSFTSNVDPYWLLGFIEGEGTFGFKNLVPYFQIGQHIKNLPVLDKIKTFLQTLPKSFIFTINSPSPVVSSILHKKTFVSVLNISSVDALYDYLLFFLLRMPFQTRKSVDFMYWSLGLHLHKFVA